MKNIRNNTRKSGVSPALAALPFSLVLLAQPLSADRADAQDCSNATSAGCSALPTMSQNLLQNRADRAASTTPSQDEITQRLNRDTWTADGNSVPTPFNASSNSVSTSLSDWRSSLTASERQRLEEAAKKDPKLKVPKPILHKEAPVDVWVNSNYQSLDGSGLANANGDATTTSVGADYKVHSNALVGGVVQMDNAQQHLPGDAVGVDGKAYMAGPYAAYKLNNNVVVDGKATWGQSNDAAHVGGDSADFSTNRSLTEARVSGTWALDHNKWKLTPSGAVTHVTEEADGGIPGSEISNVNETRLSVRPELHRPVETQNGDKIDPYAYVQSSLNLDDAALADAGPQNSIGGGVNITTTKKYSINATADYTSAATPDTSGALSGRVQLNVPLGGTK